MITRNSTNEEVQNFCRHMAACMTVGEMIGLHGGSVAARIGTQAEAHRILKTRKLQGTKLAQYAQMVVDEYQNAK